MSFGINGPTPKFGIQEAQNMRNNGGGGNLGYFQRGNTKKDSDKDAEESDLFQSSDEDDQFIHESCLDEDNEGIIQKVADFIKQFKKPRHS